MSNMGKGAAVRRGMHAARGRLQLFADADGATAIEEWARLEAAIAQGADLAIGSRALASRDRSYRVHARWHRSILGAMFNATVQRMGLEGIADTQCGFKLFRQSVARDLFSVASVNGYGFDLELLYIARRRGYRIAEVPVNWTDQPGSKVRPLRDGWVMLRELIAVRRRESQGLYEFRPGACSATQPLAESTGWAARHGLNESATGGGA
jgi:dolichyl-phosphate beta-glucosyltransferase